MLLARQAPARQHNCRAVSNSISGAEAGILTPEASPEPATAKAATMETAAMEAVVMKTVAAVEAYEDVYIRSPKTVWVWSVGRIIIPVIIRGNGHATRQHKDSTYKKKFFHRAPPAKPFCLPFLHMLDGLDYEGVTKISKKTREASEAQNV